MKNTLPENIDTKHQIYLEKTEWIYKLFSTIIPFFILFFVAIFVFYQAGEITHLHKKFCFIACGLNIGLLIGQSQLWLYQWCKDYQRWTDWMEQLEDEVKEFLASPVIEDKELL